jgi:hypothetical protein
MTSIGPSTFHLYAIPCPRNSALLDLPMPTGCGMQGPAAMNHLAEIKAHQTDKAPNIEMFNLDS